ncbi:uncharacterized protein B0T15DRAFT_506189 [Chaetomium strumarium]|uniref:Uncharacterized protein n=1 Tax=Chaetomium strumarium TaxID=1170767 RepID=A0AAJ0H0Q7_9PEZI|nr:hypothetical protein B0T15DRAFT_506189 [Chaetomium strumarium]
MSETNISRSKMPRAEQYTKNESDLYVDGLAEEGLDEGNPFKQNAADAPITDPDDAAVAALMSRDEDAAPEDEKDNSGDQDQDQHLNQPRTTNIFLRQDEPPTAVAPEDANIDLSGPHERRKPDSSSKHSRAVVGDPIGDATDKSDPDPEANRLIKRARRDSRALVIQPDDDAEEQDRKMRANADLRDPDTEDAKSKVEDDESETRQTAEDDFDRPNEVAPMPLLDKISQHKDHEPVPRDATDQDDDIETKGGDDYDVENYAEFEDDDDDMEGPARDTVGNEELMVDENELR